jgi:hypothetical protein
VTFYKDVNKSTNSLSYTITASYQGKSATASVTQEAAVYTFDYITPSTIGYTGGEYRVYVNSYRSGVTLLPTASISGGASVTAIREVSSVTNGNVEIVLNIPENNSSARTFTLSVQQPDSGKTLAITLNQEEFQVQFSLSLDEESYFKQTGVGTYQFYGIINIISNQANSVKGTWHYTPINDEGHIAGITYDDPNGAQTISVPAFDTTTTSTGTAMAMDTSAARFAGFRVEFRSSTTGGSFNGEVYNIQ